MRPVLDAINATFKKYCEPHQNVFIDESMVGMKNRVTYLQYMPNKRHSRFGIKKYELCDAVSGYVLHVELYAGKYFPIRSDPGQAQAVAIDLMTKDNLLNKGYHHFTDNCYTKPVLAQTLLEAGTLLSGTIRGNTRGIPVVPTKMDMAEVKNYRRQKMLLVAFREKHSQVNGNQFSCSALGPHLE